MLYLANLEVRGPKGGKKITQGFFFDFKDFFLFLQGFWFQNKGNAWGKLILEAACIYGKQKVRMKF